MFSRTVAEKRNGSCETTPIARRSELSVTSRTSTPSRTTRPPRHVVEARHERGERRLARARVADQRDRACPARARGRCRAAPVGPARTRSATSRYSMRPGPGGSSTAPGRSATSSGSSMISKIRSPDAVARCAWPIHMPSMRSGIDEHQHEDVEREERAVRRACPAITMRPPTSSTAACASSGRNESSGT